MIEPWQTGQTDPAAGGQYQRRAKGCPVISAWPPPPTRSRSRPPTSTMPQIAPILIVFLAALVRCSAGGAASPSGPSAGPTHPRHGGAARVPGHGLPAGGHQQPDRGGAGHRCPGLFIVQDPSLLLALLAAFVMFERRVDPAGDAFTAQASALPGSERTSRASPEGAGCRPRSGRCSCSASAAW